MTWYVGQIGMTVGVSAPFTEVLTDWTGIDASSFTTTLFARRTGEKYLASIGSNDNLSHLQTPPSSLVQTGITWTSVINITRAGNTLAIWIGTATSSGNSALTVNFAGTQLSMAWNITRLGAGSNIVQSAAAQGNPSMGNWLDATLAAPAGAIHMASVSSGGGPYPAARTGYSLSAQAGTNSPNSRFQIHHAIPGVLPAGIQQPMGFGEDLILIAVELD